MQRNMPHPSHPHAHIPQTSTGLIHRRRVMAACTPTVVQQNRDTSLRHQLKLKCTVLDEMMPVYPHPHHTQPQSRKRLLVGTLTRNSTFQFGTDENL